MTSEGGTATTGRELANIEGEFKIVAPLVDADKALEQWEAYQALSAKILKPSDFQTYTDKGVLKRFKKKSAWRKYATFYGISVETIDTRIGHRHDKASCPRLMGIDDIDCGCPTVYARVVVRAIAPNGRRTEGIGICSKSEPRGFTKPEHEIPATAYTRAANRAIADMIGGGEDSAEEVRGTADAPKGQPLEVKAAVARAWKASTDERRAAATEYAVSLRYPLPERGKISGEFMQKATEEQLDNFIDMLRDPSSQADFDPDNVPDEGGKDGTP